jgi:hypothetical protein
MHYRYRAPGCIMRPCLRFSGDRVHSPATAIFPRLILAGFTGAMFLAVVPRSAASASRPDLPADPLTQDVLRTLLSTPLGKTLPKLSYQVTKAQTYVPNAYSYPSGQLYVTLGTAQLLGRQSGLWAGILSHELGHVLLHHPECLPGFERELQRAYLQARFQRGNKPQDDGAVGNAGAKWLVAEFEGRGRHETEYAADLIGVMLMSEAGYHPQYFLILGRDLNFYLNTPKMTSFFAGHPDWGSREKRLLQLYDAALAIFDSRWPDIARSPGGKLPALGSIGKILTTRDESAKALVFRVPFRLSNPDSKPVRIALTLLENSARVPSTMAAYRSADGFLVVNADLPGSTNGVRDVVLRLPLAAIGRKGRKLKVMVFLATGDQAIAISHFKIELPES